MARPRPSTPAAARRVLVAHADALLRTEIAAALRCAGFVAVEIDDDRLATAVADELQPDLVLLDAARVRVLSAAAGDGEGSVLRFEDVTLDERSHEVSRGGSALELTRLEFELLRFFLLNPRRVVSRARILEHVWTRPWVHPGVVETYVGYLRRKLGEPRLLQTIRGVGYVLRPPDAG
jgi:DNA-binding response OmpR family regulator